jgi:hypothetical protein
VRLGAATVVRLEGALAHEVLRCLRAGRHRPIRPEVQSSGSTADCCWRRPQSASPWIIRPCRNERPRACERGRGHARSTIREGAKGGQTGLRGGSEEPQTSHRSRSEARCNSTRRATRRFPAIRLSRAPRVVRFSTLTIPLRCSPPRPCTGCGQICGKRRRSRRRNDRVIGVACAESTRGHRVAPQQAWQASQGRVEQ